MSYQKNPKSYTHKNKQKKIRAIVVLQALIHLLLNKECRDGLEKVKKLKTEDRKAQLKSLQSQHSNWKANPKADKAILHDLLKQGILVTY